MNPNKYFNLMEKTGKLTYKRIEEYLGREVKEKDLREFIKSFIKGRLFSKKRLRPILVRGVWETLRDDNWEKAIDVCAWVELWCIADYLTNDVFDNKLDKCKTEIEKDSNLFFMASAITREIAEKALRNAAKTLNPKKEKEVTMLFSELVNNAYCHQWLDYTLKYKGESVSKLKGNLNKLFKKRYIDYEAGNCFGKIFKISSILFCKKNCPKKTEALENYGKYFSSCLQIVNDIADLVNKGDDLKNQLLTYPFLLTTIKTQKNIFKLSTKKARQLFVKSGAFNKSRKKALEYVKLCKTELKNFKNREILSSALIFVWSNKYYSILKKLDKNEK